MHELHDSTMCTDAVALNRDGPIFIAGNQHMTIGSVMSPAEHHNCVVLIVTVSKIQYSIRMNRCVWRLTSGPKKYDRWTIPPKAVHVVTDMDWEIARAKTIAATEKR